MEDVDEFRRWDELIPDALGLIFRNLSLQEILTVVSRVCKSWGRAVSGPYCWQEIEIDELSLVLPEQRDRLLRMLITRSCGSLRKFHVSGLLSEATFAFLTEHSGSLQTLRIPRSEISNIVVEQLAGRLKTLTFLDLSYCSKIGASSLEAIGASCKSLAGLCRNMHPSEVEADQTMTQEDEVGAIASTMPKLKHLEMAYHIFGPESVLKILDGCPELEYLDLRGCWRAKLDPKFLNEKFPNLKIVGPLVIGYYEQNEWEDDFSDASSDFLSWNFVARELGDFDVDDDDDDDSYDRMWDDDDDDEQHHELTFYERIEDASGFFHGWPPSP